MIHVVLIGKALRVTEPQEHRVSLAHHWAGLLEFCRRQRHDAFPADVENNPRTREVIDPVLVDGAPACDEVVSGVDVGANVRSHLQVGDTCDGGFTVAKARGMFVYPDPYVAMWRGAWHSLEERLREANPLAAHACTPRLARSLSR